jgi:RNA polymerase sigma factor (sigma-70 family)
MQEEKTVAVYVVDDDSSMTNLMAAFLNTNGISTRAFSSGLQCLEELKEPFPMCLVVDFQMPEISGLEMIREFRKRHYWLPFILVTGRGTVAIAVDAMKLGAITVIEKPIDPNTFVAAVRNAISVEQMRRSAFEELDRFRKKFDLLTSRERQVADLVIEGNATKQIAKSLGISVKTVEVHRGRITKKLGITSVAQLVKLFLGAKNSFAPHVFEDMPNANNQSLATGE